MDYSIALEAHGFIMIEKLVKLYRKLLCRFAKHDLEVWLDLPEHIQEVMKQPNYLGGKYLKCKHCNYVNVKINMSTDILESKSNGSCNTTSSGSFN